ncbi:MAG: antitoxin [Pseudomonadota bacterium]|nr:antitoxin [Pseudomonadota bacterium]
MTKDVPSPEQLDEALFDDAGLIIAIDRRAAADIAAGRLLSHEAVLHWLSGWGHDRPPVPLT